jgi:hypothetical protein
MSLSPLISKALITWYFQIIFLGVSLINKYKLPEAFFNTSDMDSEILITYDYETFPKAHSKRYS